MEKKVQGIIIKSMDYKESSKIINILTNEGIFAFILRGAKQYKSPHKNIKEVVTEIEVTFNYQEKREMFSVLSADLICDFHTIKKNYCKYEIVFLLIKVINRIQNINKLLKDELYKLFKNVLLALENNEGKYVDLFYKNIFLMKSLYFLGIQPNFKTCSICDSREIFGFSLHGATCKTHTNSNSLSLEEYQLIYKMYKWDFSRDNLECVVLDYINNIDLFIKSYFEYY